MNLQQIAKRKNLYNDLSYYFKWASSCSFFFGAMNHELKKPFVIVAGVLMLISLIIYFRYTHYRKLEGE
jgi:uncharacterized membrane protein YjjP (DUF1212 family)